MQTKNKRRSTIIFRQQIISTRYNTCDSKKILTPSLTHVIVKNTESIFYTRDSKNADSIFCLLNNVNDSNQ